MKVEVESRTINFRCCGSCRHPITVTIFKGTSTFKCNKCGAQWQINWDDWDEGVSIKKLYKGRFETP